MGGEPPQLFIDVSRLLAAYFSTSENLFAADACLVCACMCSWVCWLVVRGRVCPLGSMFWVECVPASCVMKCVNVQCACVGVRCECLCASQSHSLLAEPHSTYAATCTTPWGSMRLGTSMFVRNAHGYYATASKRCSGMWVLCNAFTRRFTVQCTY